MSAVVGSTGPLVYTGLFSMSCAHSRPDCEHRRRSKTRRLADALSLLPLLLAACVHPGGIRPFKGKIEDPAPVGNRHLRAYKETHYRALGTSWDRCETAEAWVDEAAAAEVLFLGDHHEDRQLHRHLLDALSRLATRSGRKIAIGVESLGIADEPALRRFLGGHADMRDLRARIRERWPKSWLEPQTIDAGFYRSVLRLARGHDIPVFALEPTPRMALHLRDGVIDERIRLARAHMPDRLLVIIVGHAHILGDGKLVQRTGMRSVVTGARLSRSLATAQLPARSEDDEFVVSDRGVWFFLPEEAPSDDTLPGGAHPSGALPKNANPGSPPAKTRVGDPNPKTSSR